MNQSGDKPESCSKRGRFLRCMVAFFLLPAPVAAEECRDYFASTEILGTVDVPGGMRMAVAGKVAYVTTLYQGLRIIDVSNPTAPLLIGSLQTPGATRGIALGGGYAFIADGPGGLLIVDISEPSAPTIVGSVSTGGSAHDVALIGHYAYVPAAPAGLAVVDVSNAKTPVIVQTVPLAARAIVANEQVAYITGSRAGLDYGYFAVLDILDPASPQLIDVFEIYADGWDVALVGSYLYLATQATYGNGLSVYDVSDPTSPQFGYGIGVPAPFVLETTADRAYLGCEHEVLLLDISQPALPRVEVRLGLRGWARGVAVDGNHLYVSRNVYGLPYGDLQIYAIRAPAELPILAQVDTPDYASDVAVAGTIACVADHNSLQIVDLAGSPSPVIVGSLNINGIADLQANDSTAYVAANTGFKIVDISSPYAPELVSSIGSAANAVAVAHPFAYVIERYGAFRVYNISNSTSPFLVGGIDAGGDDARQIVVSGDHVFVAAGSRGLKVLDVSDPRSPRIVCSIPFDNAVGIAISGRTAYLAAWQEGLQVIDVSDPTALRTIASVLTPGYAAYVLLRDAMAYVTEHPGPTQTSGGLRLYDVSRAASPTIVFNQSSSGILSGAFAGHDLLLAMGRQGLRIVPTHCADATAIVLSDLQAYSDPRGIRLRWRAAPAASLECIVYRAIAPLTEYSYEEIGLGHQASESNGWEYLDTDVLPGQTYAYIIAVLANARELERVGPISMTASVATRTHLATWPNPTSGPVTMRFELSRPSVARAEVFDVAGRRIRHLLQRHLPAGPHLLSWDGRNEDERALPNGVYFVRLSSPDGSYISRVVVAR